jgi:hypothetical protein
MNSDTRLPSPSREEKRQNKSCKQGGSHAFSGTLLGRSPFLAAKNWTVAIGCEQQTRYNRNTTYGNQRFIFNAQVQFTCSEHAVLSYWLIFILSRNTWDHSGD